MSTIEKYKREMAHRLSSYQNVYDKIALANNGKLLLVHFTDMERILVEEMKEKRLLKSAMFLSRNDSVMVHPDNKEV